MATTEVVTGNNQAIQISLLKNKASFLIPSGAIVRAILVSYDRLTKYIDTPVDVLQATQGSDWEHSVVVVVFPDISTSSLQYQGPALIEVQITDVYDASWFIPVKIVKGNIQ